MRQISLLPESFRVSCGQPFRVIGDNLSERGSGAGRELEAAFPPNQLRISRSHVMAVRQYVQEGFELDPKNLGAVPMNGAPPK
jgi:hypothetical protein